MTRIIAIGSSHLGAVKLGWNRISSRFPGIDMQFFGAPADTFWRFQLSSGLHFGVLDGVEMSADRLAVIQKLNGRQAVELAGADIVLHVGWPLKEILNAQLLSTFSVDGLHDLPKGRRMSFSAYSAFVDAIIDDILPPQPWRNWKKPVLVMMPKPRIAETVSGEKFFKTRAWVKLSRTSGITAETLNFFTERVRSRFAEAGVTIALPPIEVYGATGLVKAQYARAVSTDDDLPSRGNDGDHSHMNADYGALALTAVLNDLGVCDGLAPSTSTG